MNKSPIGLYVIIFFTAIATVALYIEAEDQFDFILVLLSALMAIGLLLKINWVRALSSILFYISAVATGLIFIAGVGLFIYTGHPLTQRQWVLTLTANTFGNTLHKTAIHYE